MENLKSDKKILSVPENYFEELENNILKRTIHKVEPEKNFIIPKNYFGNLEQKIIERTTEKKAKVISFNRITWLKVASVAVCFTVGIFSWNYFYNESLIVMEKPTISQEDKSPIASEVLYESYFEEESEMQDIKKEPEDILYTYYTLLSEETSSDKQNHHNVANKINNASQETTGNEELQSSEEILFNLYIDEPTESYSEEESTFF